MSLNNNQFKSTAIYGTFTNVDSTNGSILANGNFQRNLTVQGNLIIGNETINNSIATDTGGTIQFTLNKVLYNLTSTILSYLININSDVQIQLNSLSTRITNILSSNNVFSGTNQFGIMTFTTSLNGISNTTFNYLSGVTSNIQSQLNTLTSNISAILTNNNVFSGTNQFGTMTFTTTLNSITPTTFNYLSGVTSNIQSQLNTISANTSSFLTNNNVFTGTNQFGVMTFTTSINGISTSVFNYLSGLSSNIQTQLNNLSTSISAILTNNNTFSGLNTFTNNLVLNGHVNQTLTGSNVQYGSNALNAITTGIVNSAFGNYALATNSTSNYNCAFGNFSSIYTTGGQNSSFGGNSLQSNTSGNYNSVLGFYSGSNITTGSFNTCLGANTNIPATSNMSTAVGYGASCSTSNQVVLGTSTETVVIPGQFTFNNNINSISSTKFSYLANVTSDIQTQINNINTSFIPPINSTYQITRAYCTIIYNGTNYVFSNNNGFNSTLAFFPSTSTPSTSPHYLTLYLAVPTSNSSSPSNIYFSVNANGSYDNSSAMATTFIVFSVFNKNIYSVSGSNYYGFNLTWTTPNSTTFTEFAYLAVNTGYINVTVQW